MRLEEMINKSPLVPRYLEILKKYTALLAEEKENKAVAYLLENTASEERVIILKESENKGYKIPQALKKFSSR